MNTKSTAILLGVLVVLFLALPALSGDEVTVIRKDGIRLKGEIVEETDDYVKLKTKYGDVMIKKDNVAEIIRPNEPKEEESQPEVAPAKPESNEYVKRFNDAVKSNTPEAFTELGKWCKENGLNDEADKAYRRAVALDPDFQAARDALGQVKVDDKWMTREEADEKGYIQDDNGDWVSKESVKEKREATEKERKDVEKYLKSKQKEYDGVPWAKRWVIKTAHYEINCNSSKEIARYYAKIMEALYNKYKGVFAALSPESHRSVVFIHRNQKEFMEMRMNNPRVGGYYNSQSRQLCGYHGTFGVTGSTLTVMAHEGCHQFQHLFAGRQFGRLPMWILEGMAVIFEAADISRRGKVDLNGPSPDRIKKLQQMIMDGNYITLRQMIDAGRGQFKGEHYNTAGAFTWWLLKASKKTKYRKLYEKYLLQCVNSSGGGGGGRGGGRGGGGASGPSFSDLCLATNRKSLTELEREWKKWVLSVKLPKLGKLTGNTFKSNKLGFEITRLDKTWVNVKQDDLSTGEICAFQKPVPKDKETESLKAFARLSVNSKGNGLGMDADEKLEKWENDTSKAINQANQQEKDSSKHYSDFKLLKKEKVKVGGFEAACFEYEIKSGKSRWYKGVCKIRRVVICTPERLYIVSGSAQKDKFDEYIEDFKKMTETMKIKVK
jgi:tetratricopeptide (TPR) repeat protein